MPTGGALCVGWTCLQARLSAKESGHSLEFNGPLQTREHSLLMIRRRKALDLLCSKHKFHSLLLYDSIYAHVLYWKGLVILSGTLLALFFFLWPECLSRVCVLFCVISENLQHLVPNMGLEWNRKGEQPRGDFKSISGELSENHGEFIIIMDTVHGVSQRTSPLHRR